MLNQDLKTAHWRKSSRSSNSGNCVEVAIGESVVGVRDTRDREGTVLVISAQRWADFLNRLQ